jgi:hypothetical protein
MKVEGVYDCESDYDSDQAEAEDVPDIVTSYASAGAFGILLVGTGPPISLFIFRRYLVGHELFLLADGIRQPEKARLKQPIWRLRTPLTLLRALCSRYIRPIRTKIITMIRMMPSPPPG